MYRNTLLLSAVNYCGVFTLNRNIIILCSIMLLLIPNTIMAYQTIQSTRTDFDPLVDIEVTVRLDSIRWLEESLLSTKPLINPVNPLFSFFNMISYKNERFKLVLGIMQYNNSNKKSKRTCLIKTIRPIKLYLNRLLLI